MTQLDKMGMCVNVLTEGQTTKMLGKPEMLLFAGLDYWTHL